MSMTSTVAAALGIPMAMLGVFAGQASAGSSGLARASTVTHSSSMAGYSAAPPNASSASLSAVFSTPSIKCSSSSATALVSFGARLRDGGTGTTAVSASAALVVACVQGKPRIEEEAVVHVGTSVHIFSCVVSPIHVGAQVHVTVSQSRDIIRAVVPCASQAATVTKKPVLAQITTQGAPPVPNFGAEAVSRCLLDGKAFGKARHLARIDMVDTTQRVEIVTGAFTNGDTEFTVHFKRRT